MATTSKAKSSTPPLPAPADPAYTTKEAAHYLGVNHGTLEVWRQRGSYGLPFEKIGISVRYRKSALDAFITRRTFVSTGAAQAAGADPKGKKLRRQYRTGKVTVKPRKRPLGKGQSRA